MRVRPVGLVAAVGAILPLVSACGSGDGGPDPAVSVVTSTNVWGDVVRQVAGDTEGSRVQVTSFVTSPDADPHSYQASPQNALAVSKADLVLENGGGYDDFLDSLVHSVGHASTTVLNAVDISGRKPASGGQPNEHVWYDVPTVAEVAARVETALVKSDPADAPTFRDDARTFDRQLKGLEQTEARIRAAHAGAGVAITEPVPLYLLEACGLQNRTPSDFSEAIENGTDVSASVLKQTEELFDQHRVRVLVYNEQTSGPETEAVLDAARANDIAVVPVTETLPPGDDYVSWMRHNLDAIEAALSR
jgi:zinc/manganese transport system substrate-binding protein